MILPEATFYLLVSAVGLVATVGFAVWLRRFSGQERQYALAAPYVTAVLTLGYFAMSTGMLTLHDPSGEPVPIPRFLAYTLTYTLVVATLGVFADVRRRLTAVGVLGLLGFVVGTIINWLTPAPINVLGKVTVLGSLVGLLYLLFGPFSDSAEAVSGPRRLLFGKLRNLMALLMIMYLIVGLSSRQGLGLLGTFSGVYVGGYLDVLGHLGYAGLLLRGRAGVEDLAAQHPAPLDYFRTDRAEPSTTDVSPSD